MVEGRQLGAAVRVRPEFRRRGLFGRLGFWGFCCRYDLLARAFVEH